MRRSDTTAKRRLPFLVLVWFRSGDRSQITDHRSDDSPTINREKPKEQAESRSAVKLASVKRRDYKGSFLEGSIIA